MNQASQRQAIINRLQLNTNAFEEDYEYVLDLLSLASGFKICAFSIVEEERQFFKARRGLSQRETPVAEAFCPKVLEQSDVNHIFVVEDATKDDCFSKSVLVTGEPHIRFYAGLPVRGIDQVAIGSLCLIDSQPRILTPEICTSLMSARALLEHLLNARSEVIRDHLTGLFNRKYFDLTLEREWRRSYRSSIPLSITMIDIDHFKSYNDLYGHQAGDAVLRQVAAIFDARLSRAADIVARYGGEEFVFVLPSTDRAGTEVVVADVIDAVSALNIPHAGSPYGRVTISAGISVAARSLDVLKGSEHFVDKADKALYRSKSSGRNRYCIAD